MFCCNETNVKTLLGFRQPPCEEQNTHLGLMCFKEGSCEYINGNDTFFTVRFNLLPFTKRTRTDLDSKIDRSLKATSEFVAELSDKFRRALRYLDGM